MADFADKKLILVLGKGGVGRSTVAAAIGSKLAQKGRRTLLYQASANDRFADFFGAPSLTSDISRLRDNLYGVNTNPAAAIAEYGLLILKFKRVYRMVFENRVTKAFLRAVPGMNDYAVLGKAWYLTTLDDWDTLVFDMPASGHSLSMLKIPRVITETVPEGPLTRDARTILSLLRDPERTSVVLVTMAEEMPVNEATDLRDQLSSELKIDITQLVVNQLYPERFEAGAPDTQVLDAALTADLPHDGIGGVAAHADLSRRRRDLNARYLGVLGERFDVDTIELPRLFVPKLGPEHIDALAEMLTA